MDNRQVGHVWAQQKKESGKGSNFYFEGATIYSYGGHFPIARFTTDAHGQQCILFTTRSYSVTTSKHITYTRGAIHGLDIPVYYVNDPSRVPSVADAETLKERAIETLLKASRARVYKDSMIQSARGLEAQFFALCKAFKIKHKDARRKSILSKDGIARMQKEAAAAAKKLAAETKRREAARAAEIKEAREKWMTGEENGLPYYAAEPVMLRIKGAELETSRGAIVPLDAARSLFELAEAYGLENIVSKSPRIGEFQITRLEGEDLIIGCHRVPYAEVKRVLSV